VLAYTGADGVMIGRGAVGSPWIFHQISTGNEFVSNQIKKQIIKEHYESMINHYGYHGMVMFRKHLHTYSKGYDGASEFRQMINFTSDIDEMRKIINSFFPEDE